MADPKAKKPSGGGGGGGIDYPVEEIILILIVLYGLAQLFLNVSFDFGLGSLFGGSPSGVSSGGVSSGGGFFSAIADNIYVARFVLSLKIVSAVISTCAWAGILYIVVQNSRVQPTKISLKKTLPQIEEKVEPIKSEGLFRGEWNALRARLEDASDKDAALLVIEADAIVDRALKFLRIPGETMGERIKYIADPTLKTADDLWEAHKMRNQIAHEGGKDIMYVDALYAIEKFEKVLLELGMI